MAGITWSKFFWSDWQADPALRLCSYAARGLWMDMLCIAASHDPIGYVAVAGRGLDATDIARMTGGSEPEAHALIADLERNGVFSRDRKGTIYSRRMIAEAKRSAIAKKNGKEGGNPSLSKDNGISPSVNPPDKPPLKPQEPEARSQKKPSSLRSDGPRKSRLGLPDEFPLEADLAWASELWAKRGRTDLLNGIADQAAQFRDHHAKTGNPMADWPAAWRTWARNALNFTRAPVQSQFPQAKILKVV